MLLLGYLLMANIQVQSVGATVPASSGSMIAGSPAAKEESFAFTLGRALESAPAFAPNAMAASPGFSPNLNASTGRNLDSVSAGAALLKSFAEIPSQTVAELSQDSPTWQMQDGRGNSPAEIALQSPADITDVPDGPVVPANDSGKYLVPGAAATLTEGAASLQVPPADVEPVAPGGIASSPNSQGVKSAPITRSETSKPDPHSKWWMQGQTSNLVITASSAPLSLVNSLQLRPMAATPAADGDEQTAGPGDEVASSLSSTDFRGSLPATQVVGPESLPTLVRGVQAGAVSSQAVSTTAAPSWGATQHIAFDSSQSAGSASIAAKSSSSPAGFASHPPVESAPATVAAANPPSAFDSGESTKAPRAVPFGGTNTPSKTTLPQSGGGSVAPRQTQSADAVSLPEPAAGLASSLNLMDSLPPTANFDPAGAQTVAQMVSDQNSAVATEDDSPAGRASQTAGNSAPANAQAHASPQASGPSEQPAYEPLIENFPIAKSDPQVSGTTVAMPVTGPESIARTNPVPAPIQTGDVSRSSGATTQTPPAPGAGGSAAASTKGAIHLGQASNAPEAERAWQSLTEPASATTGMQSSTTVSPAASRQIEPALPMPPAAGSTPTPGAALPVQPSGAATADSTGSATSANSGDSSSGGQGKAGQQNGPTTADNPLAVTNFTPTTPANPDTGPNLNPLVVVPQNVSTAHAAVSAPPTAPSSAQPPSTLSAWQNYDGGPGKIVQSASLNNSTAGAEMHLELRTSPLGPLEVHTVVHDGWVGAEIRVQGTEAHSLLSAGLPSLEHALRQQNLRVENLRVYQDLTGGSSNTGAGHDPQSDSNPSTQRQNSPWNTQTPPDIPTTSSMEEEELIIPAAGLSIRA